MAGFRPCWVTQAESGRFVTPARWTLLVSTSMQNRTHSVFSWTVSRVKKSQAMLPQAWARRNSLHVEPLRLVGTKAAGPKQRPDGGGPHGDAQLAELPLNPQAAHRGFSRASP
jgi:hypothetical protein